MVVAKSTARSLLCLRSENIPSGNLWSIWGGKTEAGEKPKETALRELSEETGLKIKNNSIQIHHLITKKFIFNTFIYFVDNEFIPNTGKECANFNWFDFNDFPEPLHWGVEKLLKNPFSLSMISYLIEKNCNKKIILLPK